MFSAMLVDDKGQQKIKLLKYKMLHILHIDATFKGTPTGFNQVLILSVVDKGMNMHTPQ
jgi:hypothetical protein